MKKISIFIGFLFFVFACSNKSFSQYYFYDENYYDNPVMIEAGLSSNAMNCLTDLGGQKGIGKKFIKDLNIGTTNASFGAFVGVNIKNKINIRLEATTGQVSAYDSVLSGITDIARSRYYRNLNFRSKITEYSALVEVHPLFIFRDYESLDMEPPKFSPYGLIGVGLFNFNPQALVGENTWVDLKPLSTEGQGFKEYPDVKPYDLRQVNIPLGLGVRYELSPIVNLRAEVIYRLLSTDYLDDVSGQYIDPVVFYNYLSGTNLNNALILNDRQIDKYWGPGGKRGNPKNDDGYFSVNFKASILFRQRIR
jgi:hypothetical protein